MAFHDIKQTERELRLVIEEVLGRPLPAPSSGDEVELRALGVDSIDHIQIAVRLKERYGVRLEAFDASGAAPFRTLKTLATFLQLECGGRADDR